MVDSGVLMVDSCYKRYEVAELTLNAAWFVRSPIGFAGNWEHSPC